VPNIGWCPGTSSVVSFDVELVDQSQFRGVQAHTVCRQRSVSSSTHVWDLTSVCFAPAVGSLSTRSGTDCLPQNCR
jgi:hypothetical protein